ncbi:CPBP family intramembrane glutamic endopeptidase [Nocardia sp. NBC_00511]|uniref:CPBP family intramembrane glutamic endopeptidase n=1 Tax=Nocardia sp. NBC_00511 TaxID=2903591 RepID=UPI0030E2E517
MGTDVARKPQVGGPVASYILLAFVASGCLLVLQGHSGIDPAALSVTQFGPVIAVAIVAMVWRERLRSLLPSAVPREVVAGRLVAVVVSCLALWGLVAGAVVVGGGTLHGAQPVGGVPFVVFVLLQVIGAAGEEVGWRGFLQPVLESRYARPVAIGLTGVVWALWHVAAFGHGPVVAVLFVCAVLGFACVLGYLAVGGFGQRVLVGTVGHALINIALYLVMGDDTLGLPQLAYYAGAALLVGALVWAWSARRTGPTRLS